MKNTSLKHLILGLLLMTTSVYGQRVQRSINEAWTFHHGNGSEAITVDLPHTWNNKDAADEVAGYYRGACKYTKTIIIPEVSLNNSIFLHFFIFLSLF